MKHEMRPGRPRYSVCAGVPFWFVQYSTTPPRANVKTLAPFLYASWVAQYMLNDVLHNPGGIHKFVFHMRIGKSIVLY